MPVVTYGAAVFILVIAVLNTAIFIKILLRISGRVRRGKNLFVGWRKNWMLADAGLIAGWMRLTGIFGI
jgi:hypothetical protein|tara:strand:+ start:70 stop:276 length:207 start_codon:yes stop_codon:yes gene_type:complete